MTPPEPVLPEPTMSATIDRGVVAIILDTRPRQAVEDDGEAPPRRAPRPRKRIVCLACGAPGHNRSNRRCPARPAEP